MIEGYMEYMCGEYEHNITKEVRNSPFYEEGMLVSLYNKGTVGIVIKHKGFSDSCMQHFYDVKLADGRFKFNVFESDIERVVRPMKLRAI